MLYNLQGGVTSQKMSTKNNIMRARIEFENLPVMDVRRNVKNAEEFDDVFSGVKLKLFGKK